MVIFNKEILLLKIATVCPANNCINTSIIISEFNKQNITLISTDSHLIAIIYIPFVGLK